MAEPDDATATDAWSDFGQKVDLTAQLCESILGVASRARDAKDDHERLKRVPSRRDGHTAVLNDGNMFIFAGARGRCKLNDLYVYKP